MKLELRDQQVALLQFAIKDHVTRLDRYLVVEKGLDEFHELLLHKDAGSNTMEALNLDEDNDKFWLLYPADCAFPPMYMVRAPDMQEAIEVFLDKTDICTISDEDLPDYRHPDGQDTDSLFYADCGKNCDISQLQAHELELLVVITKEGIKAISGALGYDKLPKIVPVTAKAPIHSQRVLDIT